MKRKEEKRIHNKKKTKIKRLGVTNNSQMKCNSHSGRRWTINNLTELQPLFSISAVNGIDQKK